MPQPANCSHTNIDICTHIADNFYDQDKTDDAIKYYQQLCQLDSAHGCRRVGLIYEYADIKPEIMKAMYVKSCELGDMTGCSNLGLVYQRQKNYKKARELFQRSCNENNQYGCFNFAQLYEYGYGVNTNNDKTSELYIKSCTLGYGSACDSAGELYYHDIKNFEVALKWYIAACDLKYASSCHDAGYQYEIGQGVEKNVSKGNEFYRKGCDLNDVNSCVYLGRAYMEYDDLDPLIKKDYAKGLALFEHACDMGSGNGCANLGYAYHNGHGVKDNEIKALELHLQGCDQLYDSSAMACYNVGWIYHKGTEVDRNLKLAKTYYEKSCAEEYGDACESLKFLTSLSK